MVGALILIPIVLYEYRVKREKKERAVLAQALGEREAMLATE